MARVLMVLFGLLFLALGAWMAFIWWPALKMVLLGIVVLLCVFLGLFLLIFGISEISGARQEKGGS